MFLEKGERGSSSDWKACCLPLPVLALLLDAVVATWGQQSGMFSPGGQAEGKRQICCLMVHFLIRPPGAPILLPKRPPKTAEEKEETIQKLEVRGKYVQRPPAPQIQFLSLGPWVLQFFSLLRAEFQSLFLFIFT